MVKDGGPAFPIEDLQTYLQIYPKGNNPCGMTLRDYFAAKAMQSLVGQVAWVEEIDIIPTRCYKIADAMLAQREK